MQRKQAIYVQGVPHWQCSTCREFLLEDEFYADRRRANGLKGQCKRCHIRTAWSTRSPENARRLNREHMRRARTTDPAKFRDRDRQAARKRKPSEKTKARSLLNLAVRKGEIVRPSVCPKCLRKTKVTAHHDDYSKPYDVEWMCYECHGNE